MQNANILHDLNLSSTLEILPDVGHAFFWEKQRELAEAIVEFLSSVPGPVVRCRRRAVLPLEAPGPAQPQNRLALIAGGAGALLQVAHDHGSHKG